MIQATRRFVATTDEVWRLQRGTDPECVFFQEMAEHGHFGGKEGRSRQGIYVCSPSGKFLGSILSQRPDRVVEMLDDAWARWEALPEVDRKLSAKSLILPKHRWEDSYPQNGLVLSMFTRDLPAQCDPSEESRVKWNRDFVWFSAKEARQWLPEDPRAGDDWKLPVRLTSRLARFHLVDVVRGQTAPMRRNQVADSTIEIRVVARDEDRVQLKITGRTKSDAPGPSLKKLPGDRRGRYRGIDTAHGVHTQLLGSATFDLAANKFTQFEVVALGARWGKTRFNGRHRDAEIASPVGFVLQLASDKAPKVAPGFIAFYDAPWVKRPE